MPKKYKIFDTSKLISKTSLFILIKKKILISVFKFITNKSSGVFFKGNDLTSITKQIYGVHEKLISTLIYDESKKKSDFFIDIGANFGFTSYQSGDQFKKIFCFEPNPICINLLQANLSLKLDKSEYKIFDFALGNISETVDLYIPKNNWGGSFILKNNPYNKKVLCEKDNFKKFEIDNYLVKKIKIKNSDKILHKIFLDLINENLYLGVIKIDVEGYERLIIASIARVMPKSMKVTIIFENWDSKLDIIYLKKLFKGRNVSCEIITSNIIGSKKSKLRKLLELIFFGENKSLMDYNKKISNIGNLVFKIS